MLAVDELRGEVESGAIDTVVVAFTDMQGRLLSKRLHADFFLEDALAYGIEGCNYLLALEMEMDPVPGYGIASWEQGYGDFRLVPDLDTLRRIPWLEATALALCEVAWHDGSPVGPSPRQVLKEQVERAQTLGYTPKFGSELEVYLPPGDLCRGPREALPRADAVRALHPRLPRARHELRRAADPPEPQRHARGRHPGGDVQGRGVAGAGTSSTSATTTPSRWRITTRSTRTAPRRSRT